MTTFWAATAILDGVPSADVRIEETAGTITAVTAGVPRGPADRVLPGVVLPGLANGHSHAFHRMLRGRTHGDGGTFWNWRDTMYRVADRLDPDSYFELATAVFAEMVLAGYTVVGEFHYVHHRPDGTPYDRGTAMEDAVVAAAARAGIRLTLLDTLYLRGGLSDAGKTEPLSPTQRRFADADVDAWAERRGSISTGPLARVGAAVHSVRAVPRESLAAVRAVTNGIPLHAHVSEQPAENRAAVAETGLTPTAILAEAGLVDARFTAVHGTHLTAADQAALAASTVCFCPTTERDLADGIGPASELAALGARLSLGSDQNAVIDPFEEMRGLEMNERLSSGRRGAFEPSRLLKAATADGYASLGWDGGRIAVGAVCDLVAVDPASVRTVGARIEQLWLAAAASDVLSVVVGGDLRVDAGRHSLGNISALLSAAIATLDS